MLGNWDQSLWSILVVFLASAIGVWFSATKLTLYVDTVSHRTKIGQAFAGLLFLGFSTSLPEIVTTVTAASEGNAELAGSNLLGGVSLQFVVLALVEAFAKRREALTSVAPKAILMLQGVVLILMLSLVIMAISLGETFSVGNVGAWTLTLVVVYIITLRIVYLYETAPAWVPNDKNQESVVENIQREEKLKDLSNINLYVRILLSALVILFSGYLVTRAAEAMVEVTGLGSHVIGATLLALTTSLPEVTTSWSALRLGAYTMAISNILGTNAIEVALFFPADLAYRKGPILTGLHGSSIFLASLGIIITALYLWGLLERKDRTVFGMGFDSFAVTIVYFIGVIILGLQPA